MPEQMAPFGRGLVAADIVRDGVAVDAVDHRRAALVDVVEKDPALANLLCVLHGTLVAALPHQSSGVGGRHHRGFSNGC